MRWAWLIDCPFAAASVDAISELRATSGLPGLPVYYSLDEGQNWMRVSGSHQLPADFSVQLVVRTADEQRSSVPVRIRSNSTDTTATTISTVTSTTLTTTSQLEAAPELVASTVFGSIGILSPALAALSSESNVVVAATTAAAPALAFAPVSDVLDNVVVAASLRRPRRVRHDE